MRTLQWSSRYKRSVKRLIKQRPPYQEKILDVMRTLQENPFEQSLHTHKLKGEFEGIWACSAGYDLRIMFEFVKRPQSNEEEILLIDIGTHDEVY
ncbi:MAG: type II toxin-antitoxin system mRNA interferase toxin, RelE/StbE family [Bacteroidota bacterium]|nr:type II toxin-antitoxin system mRNA interferase toxin, RelE/StbE family [Bacteroidota bacterium]